MIRELVMEDYEAVKSLEYQVHELHLAARPDIYNDGNPCPTGYFERIMNDKDSFKYTYVIDENIVGILIGTKQITNSIPILKPRNIYFIDTIVVDKNFRGQGIAKKLYNYLFDKAKTEDIDFIELSVWAFNHNAINFYKSLGMTEKHIEFEQKVK